MPLATITAVQEASIMAPDDAQNAFAAAHMLVQAELQIQHEIPCCEASQVQ